MKKANIRRFLLVFCIVIMLFTTGCSGSSTDILLRVTKSDGSEVAPDDIERLENALIERLKLIYVDTDKVSFSYDGDGSLHTKIGETELSASEIDMLISDSRITLSDSSGKEILSNDGIDCVNTAFDPESTESGSGYFLQITLNRSGLQLFREATRNITTLEDDALKYVSVSYNGEEIARPYVSREITSGELMLTGSDYDSDTVLQLYQKLGCALIALPCTVVLIE